MRHDMEPATIVTVQKPGREVANCCNGFDDQQANADRIILCWNCHDDLLAALKNLLGAQSARRHPLGMPDEGISVQCAEAAAKAQSAIAKAEGLEP